MADLQLEQRVRNVSRCLEENSLTVSSYVGYVMSSKKLALEKSSLAQQAVSICEIFYSYLLSRPSITSRAGHRILYDGTVWVRNTVGVTVPSA